MSKQWMIFGIKTEGADKASKDVASVGSAADDSAKEVEKLNDSLEETGDKGEDAGKKGSKGMSLFSRGLKGSVGGLKLLKTAIIGTGIGALVGLIGSLIANFKVSEEAGEKFRIVLAGLQGITVVLQKAFDVVASALLTAFTEPQKAVEFLFGKMQEGWEIIKNVGTLIKEGFVLSLQKMKAALIAAAIAAAEFFTAGIADTSGLRQKLKEAQKDINETKETIRGAAKAVAEPFVNAYKKAKTAIGEFANEVQKTGGALMRLEKRQQRLDRATRKVNVQFAQSRKRIAELKKDSDDTTLSIEDRIKATEKAADIEATLARNRQVLADEQVAIYERQIALGDKSKETADALAESQIAAAEAEIETLGVQTELMTKVQSLRIEEQAIIDENNAKQEEYLQGIIDRQNAANEVLESAQFNEIASSRAKFDELIRQAEEAGTSTVDLERAKTKELKAINEKYAQEEIERQRAIQASKVQMTLDAFGALMALNESFASEDEEANKRVFERNKKLSKGQAIINTYAAIVDALAKDATFPGSRFIAAASAGVMGLAQVRKINQTEYQSPTADLGDDGGGLDDLGNNNLGDVIAPTLDLGFLGEGAGGSIQAYVISEQVTTQQQADQLVTDQTVL